VLVFGFWVTVTASGGVAHLSSESQLPFVSSSFGKKTVANTNAIEWLMDYRNAKKILDGVWNAIFATRAKDIYLGGTYGTEATADSRSSR
jgi:hypothetical protein